MIAAFKSTLQHPSWKKLIQENRQLQAEIARLNALLDEDRLWKILDDQMLQYAELRNALAEEIAKDGNFHRGRDLDKIINSAIKAIRGE